MNTSSTTSAPLANNHISIDCAVIGFDGVSLKVLLLRRTGSDDGEEYHDMKLPGSLIYRDENLDDAARRVLSELTGIDDIALTQFKAYGSNNRTKNPRDVLWLERAQKAHVERIVTIAYFAIVKLDKMLEKVVDDHSAVWVPLAEVGELAFDHNQIVSDAVVAIARETENNRELLFDLLPKKFTALQLRNLHELLYGKPLDVRNFHKKIAQMSYVVPLEERQKGVAHRAARFYKFDRKIYNNLR